jgi:hypothetical protein
MIWPALSVIASHCVAVAKHAQRRQRVLDAGEFLANLSACHTGQLDLVEFLVVASDYAGGRHRRGAGTIRC